MKQIKALDSAGLERLAIRYVERFATSRAKLVRYLERKLGERGWSGEGPPAVEMLAARLVALGYIDDEAYAAARERAMARRGLGGRRIAGALAADGIDADLRARATAAHDRVASAIALARRRRLGPFGPPLVDAKARERAMGVFLRGGHDIGLARRILEARDEEGLEALLADLAS